MALIEIPLSETSKKIIQKEYGQAQPIRLRKKDILYQIMTFRDPAPSAAHLHDLLTTSLIFDLGVNTAARIHRNPTIGYHIHCRHLDRQKNTLALCRALGIPAWYMLETIFEFYDLDKMDLETAYKRYQRHRRAMDQKTQTKNGTKTTFNRVQKSRKIRRVHRPGSRASILARFNIFMKHYPGIMFASDGGIKKHLPKQILIYITRIFAHWEIAHIQKKMHISRASIYRAISVVRNISETDAIFEHALNQAAAARL